MPMILTIKKHSELSENELIDIAGLKDQHWPHGLASQKNWIDLNFEDSDIHIILYKEEIPVAYASLNTICCTIDSQKETLQGLGGVCVSKSCQKQGLGKKVVECANAYIDEGQYAGLLLCHKELTGFYDRCGWETAVCKAVTVAGKTFEHFVMSYGKRFADVNEFVIPKNF